MHAYLRAGSSALGAFAVAVLAYASPTRAADVKILYGMPALQASQSWFFVAQDMGYWKEQGIDAENEVLGGPQSTAALVGGDTQFADSSPTILTAVAHGQPLIDIAGTLPIWPEEIVLGNEAMAKVHVTPKSPLMDRIKALKGMTLAVNGVGTIDNVFLNHVLRLGGLDPAKDVTITPIDSASVIAALNAHRIDGLTRSPPYSTIPEMTGTGVILISGVRGEVPDVVTFPFESIAARKDYCGKNPDICRKFVAGAVRALNYMRDNPEKALAVIAPHFKGMDPALLRAGLIGLIPNLSKDGRSTEALWQNTQKIMVESGGLNPSEQISKFDGTIYTNAYLPGAAAGDGK